MKPHPTTAATAAAITATAPRSHWGQAVKTYALELLEGLDDDRAPTLENLLNGADDWRAYSYGGNALVFDADIAARLATPSELKRAKGGVLPPNAREHWLGCQARALHQAAALIRRHTSAH